MPERKDFIEITTGHASFKSGLVPFRFPALITDFSPFLACHKKGSLRTVLLSGTGSNCL